jgi:hypothetical protein
MGEIVNLRRQRKRAERAREAAKAAENRLAHGVKKSERNAGAAQKKLDERRLEAHRLDEADPNRK